MKHEQDLRIVALHLSISLREYPSSKDGEKELRASLLSYASRSLRRQEYQYVMSGGASVIAKGQVRRPSRRVLCRATKIERP
jgi:hypothetical protein